MWNWLIEIKKDSTSSLKNATVALSKSVYCKVLVKFLRFLSWPIYNTCTLLTFPFQNPIDYWNIKMSLTRDNTNLTKLSTSNYALSDNKDAEWCFKNIKTWANGCEVFV